MKQLTTAAMAGMTSLAGCQFSSPVADEARLIVGRQNVSETLQEPQIFEGVFLFRRSPRGEEQFVISAVEGEDLKVSYLNGICSRRGAFVIAKDDRVRVDVPDDQGWDVINDAGENIGRLFSDRDDAFGVSVFYSSSSRNGIRWEFVPGHEGNEHINPNEMSSGVLDYEELVLPFSELEADGSWGTVHVPMIARFRYFDVEDQEFQTLEETWELRIDFQPKQEASSDTER